MPFGAIYRRARALSVALAVAAAAVPAGAWAGQHKVTVQPVVPVYATAPAVSYYQAPAATYVQQAPTYVQQAPVAPYVQQAPTYVQQAPTYVQQAPAAVGHAPTAAAGNAPSYGSRIKVADRNDLIEDLRKEYRDSLSGGGGGTLRERRKALRESARSKYAEDVGVDEGELNDYENQDVELIVSSVIDHQGGVGRAPTAGSAPGAYPYQGVYMVPVAPTYVPAQPAMIVQPVVPVQLLVPVQPKHHLFHK